MTQQQIAEAGMKDVVYQCWGCPAGCKTIDRIREGGPEIFHQHACHRSPSRGTEYQKVVG